MNRFVTAISVCVLSACPLAADTQKAVTDHVLPRYAVFAEAGQVLADTAKKSCSTDALLSSYHHAYDAWINISHIQFGPIEADGKALAMAYWPDPKDRTGKAIARLIADGAASFSDPQDFQDVSVAAQGFPALERLLTDVQTNDVTACVLRRSIAGFIAQTADDLNNQWQDAYAQEFSGLKVTAYQTPEETQRALYTSLSTSLAFLHDQRLGRPLGTFDRPRPNRAEARRSARSQKHIILSLVSLKDLAENGFEETMTDELRGAFNVAIARAEELDDASLEGVADPAKRFRVEVLQRAVRDVQVLVAAQIAGALGITAGFNSLDGD